MGEMNEQTSQEAKAESCEEIKTEYAGGATGVAESEGTKGTTEVVKESEAAESGEGAEGEKLAAAAVTAATGDAAETTEAREEVEGAETTDVAESGEAFDSENALSDEVRGKLIFAGSVLAPFFLQDPQKGDAKQLFATMANVEVDDAAVSWPFVEATEAHEALQCMVDGLADGIATDELTREYRRLLIGPNKKPAPPWGSVYTDQECVVFGLSTLDLRAWMRAHGIARTTDERTPEDHIGLLLALLEWLAQEKPELVREFLQKHVLTWSSHFLLQFEDAADHPFYEGLARLTRLTLEGAQRELAIDVTYPRYYR